MHSNNEKGREVSFCEECKSKYYADASEMRNLCPECTHSLYGYKNCQHQFTNGRCTNCYWDGNSSDYLKQLKVK